MFGSESEQLRAARRRGDPYLTYSDPHGKELVLSLPDTSERLTIGRGMTTDLALTWDEEVSRVHAELQRLGGEWALVDDGLSRNGTYVNGERIDGRRVLFDGDELRFGDTVVAFRAPLQPPGETMTSPRPPVPPSD